MLIHTFCLNHIILLPSESELWPLSWQVYFPHANLNEHDPHDIEGKALEPSDQQKAQHVMSLSLLTKQMIDVSTSNLLQLYWIIQSHFGHNH